MRIEILISRQELHLYDDEGAIFVRYPVSTAANGLRLTGEIYIL